jgi:hypothetical protein
MRLLASTRVGDVRQCIAHKTRETARPTLTCVKHALIHQAATGDFGLSAGDIQKKQTIPPGHSAIIVLFENVWERKFKDFAKKYGGAVADQRLISSAALATAARDLGAAGQPPVVDERPRQGT